MTNEDLDNTTELPEQLPEAQEELAQPKKKATRKKNSSKEVA